MKLTKIGSGDWAEVYLNQETKKVYKFIYQDDSTQDMFARIKEGAKLQNKLAKLGIAPRVYSIGWFNNRIVISLDYLEGYQPLHDTAVSPRRLSLIGDLLAIKNISHNDINSGNVLVSPSGDVKLIDFDQACINQGGSKEDRNLLIRLENLYSH